MASSTKRFSSAVAVALWSCAVAAQQVDVGRSSIAEIVAKLHPGQFVWVPQAAPRGPLLLVVNVATQRAILFRNGVPIAASTASTGKTGHETPTGVFTILQKQVEHYSSKYDGAPMPLIQRLTWQGVALHAGRLPGYPASHSCIRLPRGFAKLLYSATIVGMTVVIAQKPVQPRIAPTPELLMSSDPASLAPSQSVDWNPSRAPEGPISIVVSPSDGRAVVLRNGVVIGSAPVTVRGPVTDSWAYMLRSREGPIQRWIRVPLSSEGGSGEVVSKSEWQRFEAPEWFRPALRDLDAPGTTIVVTPDSLAAGAVAQPISLIEGDPPKR